jgi:predicted exporter
VIDAMPITQIDAAGEQAVWSLHQDLVERGITMAFAGRKRQIEANAAQRGISEQVSNAFLLFSNLKQARIAFAERNAPPKSKV